jgi:predicted amidohydrolase
MRIALGQFGAVEEKAANIARMAELSQRAAAAGAELVVFPEAAMAAMGAGQSLSPVAESLEGPFVTRLRDVAAKAGIGLVAGMFESGAAGPGRVFNTVVVIDTSGGLVGSYRKIHLYDAFGYRESEWIQPGDGETCTFELGGWRIGVMTCYELRFPEMSRRLVDQGAQVLLVPAAWVRGPLKEMHWTTLARARAIENTSYVAAASQVGDTYIGLSALFDPMGVEIAGAAELEGLVVGDLSAERLRSVRENNPSLSMRRPEVYERWWTPAAHSIRL